MGGSLATFLERVEAACASVVERAFASAFPTPIEPVQIARKLVAAFESGSGDRGRGGRRFHVRLSVADHARLASDLTYLQAQWTAMLVRLAQRGGQPQRAPEVVIANDPSVATGTVSVGIESLTEPVHLALRVRHGLPSGGAIELGRPLVVGRDPSCDLVLVDARVSRKHLAIDEALRFTDLGSANGTRHNGVAVASGTLGLGDVLALGDCELVVADAA